MQVKMESGFLTLVYTIGDEMSFTEFIMALRRIVADHPYREELLDGHDLLNLSSSREHPVLARHRSKEPVRWLRIKLQVEEEEGKEPSWTILIMRDDNLYVLGFINKRGDCYELRDGPRNASTGIFPSTSNSHELYWGVSYRSILDCRTSDDAVRALAREYLGRHFARNAVRRLSSYTDDEEITDLMSARLALAGLILMVCESARMNPLHDLFVRGWKHGTRWTTEMMKDYVWKYGDMSLKLLTWKSGWYAKSHPIKELQAIYLVLNTDRTRGGNPDRRHQPWKPSPGNPGSGGGPPGPSHRRGGGSNGDRGGGKRKRDFNDRPQSHQRKKPYNAGSSGGPTCKSEEASDTGSGGGRGRKSEHASAADRESSPDSQSEESSDAGSPGQSDSEETSDDSGSSGGNSSGQPRDGEADDDTQCLGRPRVELLSMRANLGVIGTKIIVFDGKRGQIVYTKKELGEQVYMYISCIMMSVINPYY
jgi:hypothetical protein